MPAPALGDTTSHRCRRRPVLTNLLVLCTQVCNAELNDHEVLSLLSTAVAGSLYSGLGHSNVYERSRRCTIWLCGICSRPRIRVGSRSARVITRCRCRRSIGMRSESRRPTLSRFRGPSVACSRILTCASSSPSTCPTFWSNSPNGNRRTRRRRTSSSGSVRRRVCRLPAFVRAQPHPSRARLKSPPARDSS
ncbi:hypothetical protein V8E36_001910 [Tilletia maclaganii]